MNGITGAIGVARAVRVFVVALLWLGLIPAAAQAATLSTAAATNVQTETATLNGSASGFTLGECAFAYGEVGAGPNFLSYAVPCTSPYHVTVTGLRAGDDYFYAAVHCPNPVTSGGVTTCQPNSQTLSGYDQPDPCLGANTCPYFTTEVPTGTTQPATSVTGATATFNGTIDPIDESYSSVQYAFEYSPDPNLTGFQETPFARASATVSMPVSGLTPGTVYYYRIVVNSIEAGPSVLYNGNIVSFHTAGFARTDPATSITGSGATLNGEVSAAASALTYSWVYSTSSATGGGGVLDSGVQTVSGGSVPAEQDQNVSAALGGLGADTTYYFQLVTSDPSIHGQVLSFTTAPTSCASGSDRSNTNVPGTGFLLSGCWSASGGTWTGYGSVAVNGLAFSGPQDGTVTINTSAGNISTSVPYDVDVHTTLMYDGAISGALNQDFQNSSSGTATTTTFDLGATAPGSALYDLPLGGVASVTASSSGGSTVQISALGLPSLFGGVTAQGSVSVGNDGSVDGVSAQLGDSTIGPITLPGFTLTGDPATNTWSGDVNLNLPLAKFGIGVSVQIVDGRLNGLGGSFSGPGIPLDESGLELDSGSFSSVFSPLTLQGSLDVSFGPKIGQYTALDINAGFYAGFNQDQTVPASPILSSFTLHDVPFTLGITGTLNLLSFIQLANASFYYYGVPGAPFITFNASLASPLIASCGKYGLGVDPNLQVGAVGRGAAFNIYGTGGITLDLCDISGSISATALISSTGMAFCGNLDGLEGGVGLTWPSSIASLSDITSRFALFSGCDLSNYIATVDAARAGAAPPRIRLPRGLPFAVIRVRGRGAPPILRLSGPKGKLLSMSSGGPMASYKRYLVIPDPRNDTTYIELGHPARGGYTITAQPGSAPIAAVSVAHGLPAPRVTGRLRRRGRQRILRWHARRLPGQRLEFHEVGGAGDRLLLRTMRSAGTLRFRPAAGLAGPRYLEVDVYEHGMLARVIRLARFSGPKIRVPRPVTQLRLARHQARLIARWRRAASAFRYLVMVVTSDGRHRLFVTRKPRLSVEVPARGEVSVSVTPANALGQHGRAASARTGTAPEPKAVTKRAGQVRRTTARLNGTVNGEGLSTSYWFQWGVAKGHGHSTRARKLPGTSFRHVSVVLRHLRPGTRYHFRVLARNGSGKAFGRDMTFRTRAKPKRAERHRLSSTR